MALVADRSAPDEALHRPVHPVRVVTATSLFDGHDASITQCLFAVGGRYRRNV